MNTKTELLELQELVRKTHTELLDANKQLLEVSVRLNDLIELSDENG